MITKYHYCTLVPFLSMAVFIRPAIILQMSHAVSYKTRGKKLMISADYSSPAILLYLTTPTF